MAGTESVNVSDRWQSSVDHEMRERIRALEEEQKQHQEQVHRETGRVLPIDRHVSTSPQADENGPAPTTHNRREGRYNSNGYREKASAVRNQPTFLPTPPQSPPSSALEVPISTTDQDEIARCRAKVIELQAKIVDLQSELNAKEIENRTLESRQTQALRLHRQSIRTATDDEIRRLKKQVDDLEKLAEEQEKTIDHLRNELRETKREKSEVEDQLAEARSTMQRRDRQIESAQDSADASIDTHHYEPAPLTPPRSPRSKESKIQQHGLAFNCRRGERRSAWRTAKDTLEGQKCPDNVKKYGR